MGSVAALQMKKQRMMGRLAQQKSCSWGGGEVPTQVGRLLLVAATAFYSTYSLGRPGTRTKDSTLKGKDFPPLGSACSTYVEILGSLDAKRGLGSQGAQFVIDVLGRQEAEPRDRGPLSACRWAGRSGLCGQAQGPAGCKLISQLLKLPRRGEQLEGPA